MTQGPRYRVLADELAARIRAGEWAPGSKVPALRDMYGERGESTVRDAMRLLREAGLVVTVPGSGTYVADPLPGERPTLEQRVDAHDARLEALEAWRAEHERGHRPCLDS